jgi:hypothetical protein
MMVPLDDVIVVLGRPEPAAEAVVEGVQVPAEVAGRAVDGLTHDEPEILQAPYPATVNAIDNRHELEDSPLPARNPC